MAKADSKPETTVKHAGTMFAFKVIKKIRVPTLKTEEGQTLYIRAISAIEERVAEDQDDNGLPTTKTVHVLRVGHLQLKDDGSGVIEEEKDLVVPSILLATLNEFEGGNKKYVGVCFAITKGKNQPGKRYKLWSVDQIADPNP